MDKSKGARNSPRIRLAILAALTIALGLLSRRYPIAGNYPGDALWATLVYLLWTFILPTHSRRLHLTLAASTAACVEFGQLYHSPWIDSVRQTLPGKLVLGSGFDPFDLIAYAIGCLIGLACVLLFVPRSNASKQ